jgi:hypothetical protein
MTALRHHVARLIRVSGGHASYDFADEIIRIVRRDSDGTAIAAINEDLSVPKDCQARAESIAPKGAA